MLTQVKIVVMHRETSQYTVFTSRQKSFFLEAINDVPKYFASNEKANIMTTTMMI